MLDSQQRGSGIPKRSEAGWSQVVEGALFPGPSCPLLIKDPPSSLAGVEEVAVRR